MDHESMVEDSFTKAVGKTFLVSTAASAGTMMGFLLFGAVLKLMEDRRNRETETTKEK